jgi:hypothetical protein
MPEHPRRQGKHALKHAARAARRGDLAAAERWSRIAERMAEAAQNLSAAPPDDAQAAETIRAELRQRFARLAACEHANQTWECEREAHERLCAQARRTGAPLPPPLAPAPFSDEQLQHIAKGEA